jgi:hypothetical protein
LLFANPFLVGYCRALVPKDCPFYSVHLAVLLLAQAALLSVRAVSLLAVCLSADFGFSFRVGLKCETDMVCKSVF